MSAPATRNVRVLLIGPPLGILGGQSVQADYLMRALSRVPSVDIAFLPINPRLPGPLAALQSIRYVRTFVTTLYFCWTLLRAAPRFDILHIFCAAELSFWFAPTPALILARILGRKSILHYHDGRAEEHLRGWKTAIPTIRLADRLIAPSGFLVEVFARYGLKAAAIPNVIDLQLFPYRERSRPRPVFLHNRGLEPLYNVPCTLRAFQLIQRRYPDASLILAHNGSLRAPLEQLAAGLGLRNVRFAGQIRHPGIPGLYDSADVYLTSPNQDCMPVSLLECFACGLPVVATKAGGIPHIVTDGETGLLVELNDHEALAARAFRLLEEEGLAARLALRARQEAERYDVPRVIGEWVRLYQELSVSAPPG